MSTFQRSRSAGRPKIDFRLIAGILGAFTFFMGFALLIPIPVSIYFAEETVYSFAISSAFAFVLGGLIYFIFKPKDEIRPREAFFIVSVTWIVLSVFGSAPFLVSGVVDDFADAFFETISGLTTTGATIFGGVSHDNRINPNIEDLPKSIVFWRSILHWIGGMGFIVLSIAILPFLGLGTTNLLHSESSILESDKLTPRVQETAKLLWGVYLILTLAHFVLLWLHPKMDWFEAINHAMSTMATGGFSTKDSSILWFDSAYIDWVIILFMFLAGISFAMHFRLLRGETKLFLNNRETRFYSFIVVLASFLISTILIFQTDYTIPEVIRHGTFQALSIITTTGYVTNDYGAWPSLALIILIALFFTGGCAGSTSGGIKMFRHMILIRAVGREIRQSVHPKAVIPLRVGNVIVEPPMVRRILSFFMLYVLLFLGGAVILTWLGSDPVSALSASIASLGNIGPALGEFGPTNNYAGLSAVGKWALSLLMIIGRLELFTVLVLFSVPYWKE